MADPPQRQPPAHLQHSAFASDEVMLEKENQNWSEEDNSFEILQQQRAPAMADTPHIRLSASPQHVSLTPEHLQGVEMREDGSPDNSSVSQPVAQSGFSLEDADLSMSAEEMDADDLLDVEEEYEKELAVQRREDIKNGHFFEEDSALSKLPELPALPSRSPVVNVDDDRLHSLCEIQEMKDFFCDRLEEAHANAKSHLNRQKLPLSSAGQSMKIRQKVAVFESITTPYPPVTTVPCSAQGGSPKPTLTAAASTCPSHLQKTLKKGKKGHGRNQDVKECDLHASFAGKSHTQLLHPSGDAFHEVRASNDPANISSHAAEMIPTAPTKSPAAAAFSAGNEGMEELMAQLPHAIKPHCSIKDILKADNTKESAILPPLPAQSANKPHCHHHTAATSGSSQQAASLGLPPLGQVSSPPTIHHATNFTLATAQSPSPTQPNSFQPTQIDQPNPTAETDQTVPLPPAEPSLQMSRTLPSSSHSPVTKASKPQSSSPQIIPHPHIRPAQNRNKNSPNKPPSNRKNVELAVSLFSGPARAADRAPSEDTLMDIASSKGMVTDEEMVDFPPLQSRPRFKDAECGSKGRELPECSARRDSQPGGANWRAINPPSTNSPQLFSSTVMEEEVPSNGGAKSVPMEEDDTDRGGQSAP